MIRIGKSIILFFAFLLVYACGTPNSKELAGNYVGYNYSRTIDSISLKQNGSYSRKVTSINNELIFENTGSWEVLKSEILFSNFLVNNDELYTKYIYDERFLSTALFSIQNYFGEIRIIENHDKNYFFKKVD